MIIVIERTVLYHVAQQKCIFLKVEKLNFSYFGDFPVFADVLILPLSWMEKGMTFIIANCKQDGDISAARYQCFREILHDAKPPPDFV